MFATLYSDVSLWTLFNQSINQSIYKLGRKTENKWRNTLLLFVFIKPPCYRGAKSLVRIILKGFKVHVAGTTIPLRNYVLLAKGYSNRFGKTVPCKDISQNEIHVWMFSPDVCYRKKGQSIIRAKIFPLINYINFKNIIYVVKIFQLLPRR